MADKIGEIGHIAAPVATRDLVPWYVNQNLGSKRGLQSLS
jgi:hypothetical protein